MRVATVAITGVLFLSLTGSPGLSGQPATAQEVPAGKPAEPQPTGDVPEVGQPLLADPLVGPGTSWPTWTCPSGRNKAEPVGEGYIFKVTGKCAEGEVGAQVGLKLTDIVFPDGEIRLDVKVVSGHDRANFVIGLRDQDESFRISRDSYQAGLLPSLATAVFLGRDVTLAIRKDLTDLLLRDDWNTVAVRARGNGMWLLIRDQLVAQVSDSQFDRGKMFFVRRRLGDLDDTAESAVVIRNFRVSGLAAGDPARAPSILKSKPG